MLLPHTPLCVAQAKRGALKDCPADDMLAAVLQATVDRTGVEPEVNSGHLLCIQRVSQLQQARSMWGEV